MTAGADHWLGVQLGPLASLSAHGFFVWLGLLIALQLDSTGENPKNKVSKRPTPIPQIFFWLWKSQNVTSAHFIGQGKHRLKRKRLHFLLKKMAKSL
jgi:hypothetical protein